MLMLGEVKVSFVCAVDLELVMLLLRAEPCASFGCSRISDVWPGQRLFPFGFCYW